MPGRLKGAGAGQSHQNVGFVHDQETNPLSVRTPAPGAQAGRATQPSTPAADIYRQAAGLSAAGAGGVFIDMGDAEPHAPGNEGFRLDPKYNAMIYRRPAAGAQAEHAARPPAPAADVYRQAAGLSAADAGSVSIDMSDAGPHAPEELRFYQLSEKANRSQKTGDAKLMLLHDAMSGLSEANNGTLKAGVRAILDSLSDTDPAKAKLEKAYGNFCSQQLKLKNAYGDFLSLRSKQKHNELPVVGSFFADRNSALFGKSMPSVILRASLQSAVVVGGSAALQAATVAMLASMLAKDPSLLPEEELAKLMSSPDENIPTTLSEHDLVEIAHSVSTLSPDELLTIASVTDEQIEKMDLAEVIDQFVKPGSTYIDESNATTGEIYAAEAGIGGARGIVLAAADNQFESAARDQKLKDSLKPTQPTSLQKVAKAAGNSARSQFIGGAISLGIGTVATLPGQVQRGMSGGSIGEELAKNGLSAGFSAVANVVIDGFRTLPPMDKLTDQKKQILKAGLRVAARIGLQYAKTGISLAFSGKSWASQGGEALIHTQHLMTGGVSGAFKEAAGMASQVLTNKFLPADELFAQEASKTVKLANEIKKTLMDPSIASASGETLEHLSKAREQLDAAFEQITSAADLKPNAPGVQEQWDAFDRAVDSHGELSEVVSTQPISRRGEVSETAV